MGLESRVRKCLQGDGGWGQSQMSDPRRSRSSCCGCLAEREWEGLEPGRPSGNRQRGPRVPSRRVWISSCRQQGAKRCFSAGKPHAWLVSTNGGWTKVPGNWLGRCLWPEESLSQDSGAADPGVGWHRGVQGGLAGVGETRVRDWPRRLGRWWVSVHLPEVGGGTLLSTSSLWCTCRRPSTWQKLSVETGRDSGRFMGCGRGQRGTRCKARSRVVKVASGQVIATISPEGREWRDPDSLLAGRGCKESCLQNVQRFS